MRRASRHGRRGLGLGWLRRWAGYARHHETRAGMQADQFVADLRGEKLTRGDLPSAAATIPVAAVQGEPPWGSRGGQAAPGDSAPPADSPGMMRLGPAVITATIPVPVAPQPSLAELVQRGPWEPGAETGPPTLVNGLHAIIEDDLGGYLRDMPTYPDD